MTLISYLGNTGLYAAVLGFAVMLLMPDRSGQAAGGSIAVLGGVAMGYELVLAHWSDGGARSRRLLLAATRQQLAFPIRQRRCTSLSKCERAGGPTRSRTGLQGFAVPYITALTSDQHGRRGIERQAGLVQHRGHADASGPPSTWPVRHRNAAEPTSPMPPVRPSRDVAIRLQAGPQPDGGRPATAHPGERPAHPGRHAPPAARGLPAAGIWRALPTSTTTSRSAAAASCSSRW